MKRINSALFLASVASMALASAASATPPGPNDGDNALHGAGASSVTNVLNDEFNSKPPLAADFAATYVPTGSGNGKAAWRSKTPQVVAQPTWNTVQFAFSDSSITAGTTTSDLDIYNVNVKPFGGNGIQVPKFVLPVAFAYNPVYAKNPTSGVEYRFNVQAPQSLPDAVTNAPKIVGGLRLSRAAYCGIFNGTIKNWNNNALTTLNGGVSLKDPADPNWGTVDSDPLKGVPIRLVGRLDKSGTTDIFTRALKAQCSGTRYGANSEALAYNPTPAVGQPSAPDFTTVRSDSPYKPGAPASNFTSTEASVGNQYFDKTSLSILAVSGGVASQPTSASGDGTGLFLLADGSGTVSKAIEADPDIGTSTYKVNGKIGYIGADFIANAKGASNKVFAAALSRPSDTATFHLPSAANATDAFTGILPPQSASTGAWQVADTRLVRNPTGGTDIQARRNNPLAWYDVLYVGGANLAAPTAGYPITGTTQALLNTCYKTNNFPHIVQWLGYNYGTPTTTFTNPTTGLLAKSNIAAVSDAWKRAVIQTFLVNSNETNSSQRLGDLDLWIESAATSGKDHCNVTGN
ncbi:substrate-binding domain-containing protein [Sphingobium cupriresistens]|uniref:substrate-binding domain-containing protein n=1 Tax=Sphingobium cupriresistens TaxID=1132417 RepID=UPI003BADFFA8